MHQKCRLGRRSSRLLRTAWMLSMHLCQMHYFGWIEKIVLAMLWQSLQCKIQRAKRSSSSPPTYSSALSPILRCFYSDKLQEKESYRDGREYWTGSTSEEMFAILGCVVPNSSHISIIPRKSGISHHITSYLTLDNSAYTLQGYSLHCINSRLLYPCNV